MVGSRQRVHVRLGLASFAEYVERLFGYAPRLTHEKLRVAEALEQLPRSAEALRSGARSWSALRELTRVATPETEAAWLDAVRSKTVREVERLVSGHAPGSLPNDAVDPRAVRQVLRFEVSSEVKATFSEAVAKLRRDAGESLDDDALLLLFARYVLNGPGDEGSRSSYQVMLTRCEGCGQATQQSDGERLPVDGAAVAIAACDAQVIPADAHVGGARAAQTVPPALRRAVIARDAGSCAVPGCRHATFVDVHHIKPREEGGRHVIENLITLCSAHHRAVHRGTLAIERREPTGLVFRHADGAEYGSALNAELAAHRAQAFRALRRLGFGESAARGALRRSRVAAGANVADIVRDALREL